MFGQVGTNTFVGTHNRPLMHLHRGFFHAGAWATTIALTSGYSLLRWDHSLLRRDHFLLHRGHSLSRRGHSLLRRDPSLLRRDPSLLHRDHSLLRRDHSLLHRDHSLLRRDLPCYVGTRPVRHVRPWCDTR